MNPYVLAWTLISASGVLLSVLLMLESFLDVRSLRGVGNGRSLHAKARVVSHGILLVIHAGFLYIGLRMLDAEVQASQAVFVLIAANAMLIVLGLVAWLVRRYSDDHGLTAAEVEAEAIETALRLRTTAERAAQRLLDLAALTAQSGETHKLAERTADDQKRSADASERTADASERMAENTDPKE